MIPPCGETEPKGTGRKSDSQTTPPGIHQIYFESSFFQNVVDRDPVHPSRLQGYGPNRTLLQPHRHLLQFRRSTSEAAYGLAVPCRRHGHIMRFVADINACGMGMDHFQAEVFALDFPRHLSPLFAVHLVPVVLRWAAACLLVFLQLLGFHANLHGEFNSARPGRRPLHSLSIGVGPLFFSERRRHHLHNRQYRSHAPLSGRNAPYEYAALAAELCCA